MRNIRVCTSESDLRGRIVGFMPQCDLQTKFALKRETENHHSTLVINRCYHMQGSKAIKKQMVAWCGRIKNRDINNDWEEEGVQ